MTTDVAIIGGAAIGSAVASFLKAELGFAGRVVVVERDPGYQDCSTTRSAASIRTQFSTPVNIALSRFGFDYLRRAEDTLAVDGELPPINLVERGYLYLATDAEMLDTLRTATGETVLMIGHMPGIGDLARGLRQDPPPAHSLFAKYPTGAATVLDFQIDDWADAQFGSARFEAYVAPADL